MLNIMIVESPNKIQKLETILGKGWKVLASVGHVRDLPLKELGIEKPDFILNYEYIPSTKFNGRTFPGGKERVERLKKEIQQADMIYLASDPDREGEAIAWHLKETLGLAESNYKRVTFDEITPNVIRKALNNPRKINYALVRAQEARRALDRLVGYAVSPLISDQLGIPLSAGRVQSPAVRLVVDRERRITAFKKTKHFGAVVSFDNGAWQAEWNAKPFTSEEAPYVLDEVLAMRAAASREFLITKSNSENTKRSPPSPFSTSLLLQAASVSLKFNPELTAKLAQKLFEQGLVTYIRTDGVNISDEAIEEIRTYANDNNWPLPEMPRKFKAKGSAQEGHEAIRPTHINVEEAGDDDQQKALYQLIWLRTVASQLADAKYNVSTVELISTDGNQSFEFKAKGRVLTELGWRVLTEKDATEEEEPDNSTNGSVPMLSVNSVKRADEGKLQTKETKPPSRYTQASLIAKLEAEGIGRPSTYSAIMQNIIGKGYLVEAKRLLEPAELGISIVNSLVNKFSFIELPFTRELEKELDEIANGRRAYIDVLTAAFDQLQTDISAVEDVQRKRYGCSQCETGTMRRYKRKTGGFLWACSNEECSHFMDDADGKPVEQVVHKCPKCITSPLRRYQKKDKATGKRKGFGWFCTSSECNTFLDDKAGKPVEVKTVPCPSCQKPMYRRKGPYGFFWGCSGYKNGCKTIMEDKAGKPVKVAAK